MATFTNQDKKTDYNPSTTYSVNDVVYYGGLRYKCILESTGNLPTNETYWILNSIFTNQTKNTKNASSFTNETKS